MGLFGGDTTKTYSTTKLTQEDKSVKTGAEAENVLGSGAKQASGAATMVDQPRTEKGDIVVNQYPEAVQGTVEKLIHSVDTSAQQVGQALSQQQLGGETQLPKIILYLVVGGGVLLVISKVLSR